MLNPSSCADQGSRCNRPPESPHVSFVVTFIVSTREPPVATRVDGQVSPKIKKSGHITASLDVVAVPLYEALP